MPKLIDNDNDAAAVPETAYQAEERPMSGRRTSLSVWGLLIAALLLIAIVVFAFTRSGSHTDPAPNGGAGGGTAAQPAPAQNSQ